MRPVWNRNKKRNAQPRPLVLSTASLSSFCKERVSSSTTTQRTNGSTNVKTFTSPDNLDLFN